MSKQQMSDETKSLCPVELTWESPFEFESQQGSSASPKRVPRHHQLVALLSHLLTHLGPYALT